MEATAHQNLMPLLKTMIALLKRGESKVLAIALEDYFDVYYKRTRMYHEVSDVLRKVVDKDGNDTYMVRFSLERQLQIILQRKFLFELVELYKYLPFLESGLSSQIRENFARVIEIIDFWQPEKSKYYAGMKNRSGTPLRLYRKELAQKAEDEFRRTLEECVNYKTDDNLRQKMSSVE